MSTEMNPVQDPNAPMQPPPPAPPTSQPAPEAAAGTGNALEPAPSDDSQASAGDTSGQSSEQDGTPSGGALDGKKKELSDKKSALDQLQKDVAKLKAEIQLMETGASENQSAAERYKMARAKWAAKLSGLPSAVQTQIEAVASQLGSNEAALNEKMKGPEEALEQAATKVKEAASGADQAEQSAAQAAQKAAAAEDAYEGLKNGGAVLEKHASAITAKASKAEGMKQKDPAATFVMLAQVKQESDALQLMTDEELKSKLQQSLSELNTSKQAAQTAQEELATAKQAAQTAQKEYELKAAHQDAALAAAVGG